MRCVGHFKPYISHCKCHGDMEKSEQPVAFEMNRSEQSRLSSQPFASLGAIPPFLASQTYTRHTSQGGCSPSHRLTCRTWIHPSMPREKTPTGAAARLQWRRPGLDSWVGKIRWKRERLATHSSILAWRIPHRHTHTHTHTHIHKLTHTHIVAVHPPYLPC